MKTLLNKTFAVTAIAMAITGCNSDELPAEAGNSFGQLALSGIAKVGETLTASVTDGNGVDASAINYSWMADGAEISGASSSTLVLTEAHAGSAISVSVSYVDNDNYAEKITSKATGAVLVNYVGVVEITGILEANKLLTATLVDDNGFDAEAVTFAWYADNVAIDGANEATFALTDNEVGKKIKVMVTYVDNDEYVEEIESLETDPIAPAAANTPATFDGLTASVTNDVTEAISGTITVMDDDVGEAGAQPQADVITTFGMFSITESGDWTYLLDTANPTVASLSDESDIVTDTISVLSIDGTEAELVISISGVGVVAATKAARITDNMTDDAGELRYKVSGDAILQGKLVVSFLKEDKAETADGVAKDAYIGLFGESSSTSNAIVDLRIQADKYVIRDQDDIEVTIPFVPDVWTDVEMTWDASSATDSVPPLVTITINGTSVTTEAFVSASSSLTDVMTGVRYAIFKLGDNSSTIPDAAYYVDDFKLTSDLAGAEVVFEDDFESYEDGTSLDTDNPNTPYNGSSAEVFVEQLGTPGVEPGNPDNLVAQITDNMTDDAGELRYKLDAAEAQGKLTVSFYKDDKAETADGVAKDAYIGIYGESTSTSNAILDLRIQADKFVLRDQEFEVPNAFIPDAWNDVEITWDASAATDSVPPMVTISINGESVTSEPFASASGSLSDVMTGVRYAIFKLGDNSSTIPNAAYFVDDVKIFSDLEGTTSLFEDNFEGYSEGDSLDTDNDASPYNSSTAEARVVKKAK